MTNDSAIPDFNSDNSVSQTDSKQSHEESAAIEDDLSNQNDVEENFVHFISSTSNFNRKLEETTVISDRKLDSEQTETESNSAVEETTVISDAKLDSEQTETESNSAVEETAVISDGKLDSEQTETESNSAVVEKINPVEQQINDRISIDIPLLENAIAANQKIQVEIRSEKDRLVLTLPSLSETSVCEYSWSEIWQQMKLRLLAQKRFFSSKISVHLIAYDRLLDSRQLQDIADTLSELSLQLKSVGTNRRQTAIAAAGGGYSVEQLQPKTAFSFESYKVNLPPAEPLYMETTVRSGVEIRHRGSVIILGDVNPGGIVVADGDILIWGRLRGVAHAGAQGNSECTIMALQMEPTQLRIANALARAPEKTPTQPYAEVAYMTTQGIRITNANDFSRKSINAG
ncbi:MAG: septum site-determining protein MinC [Rivularia sp. (in: cyanobacteria)]